MVKAIVLGSGAAWPDAKRNPPGFAVVVDDEALLFDAGGGTAAQLMRAGIKPASIKHYFLSHIHIDHCVEFPSLVLGSYLTGKKDELYVYGPPGVQKWCNGLIDDVYYFTRSMAKKLRGVDIDIRVTEVAPGLVVETPKWKVTTAKVKHTIETFAYRVDAEDGSITYSGDTAPCQELIDLAQGSDILLQDCAFPDHVGEKPAHSIPRQVGEIARQANVRKVVLFHMFPICEGHEQEMVNSVKSSFSGEVIMSEDLMEIAV